MAISNAETDGASSITDVTARVEGTLTGDSAITPNGCNRYYFEYGTSASLGGTHSSTKVATISGDTLSVSQLLTELSAGTLYYFRLVGDVSGVVVGPPPGPFYGTTLTFTTLGGITSDLPALIL